jgi:hypothetical protein
MLDLQPWYSALSRSRIPNFACAVPILAIAADVPFRLTRLPCGTR